MRPIATVLCLLLLPLTAAAGTITASVTAAPNTGDPALGAWIYTVDVSWDTGTPYGLSHVNLYLDPAETGCTCQEIASSLVLSNPAGSGTGEPDGCNVVFTAELNCQGDPSIGLSGIVLKFEADDGDGCEAGPTGQATFTFGSPYPPGDIVVPNTLMTDKYGQLVGEGTVSGVFPSLACNPVPAATARWGTVKARYSH